MNKIEQYVYAHLLKYAIHDTGTYSSIDGFISQLKKSTECGATYGVIFALVNNGNDNYHVTKIPYKLN